MLPITFEDSSLRQKVIAYIWPVAALFFVIYIFISFFISKDYLGGWILIAVFLFFIITLLIYFKTKNVWLIGNVLATIGIPVILPWLVTGGPYGVGFWWSLVYVVWAFSVTNKQSAVFWLIVHLFCSIVIVGLSLKGILKIAYPILELLNLLFAYAITTLFVYFLLRVLEYYLQLSNKRAEELAIVNKDLISAINELDQFAYVASHDLMGPLRTITNFVGLIEKKCSGKTDADTEQYMKFIVTASAKMQNLIKDLFYFSRIGRNSTFEKINCNDILKEVIAEMDESIKEAGAKVTSSVLPVLKGNEIELKQLLMNLLSNAIKFRKKNIPPDITITVEEKSSEFIFAMKDNGIGIEKQYINKLFVLFQRLHSEIEYPGTGIGLATCKKIVSQHGGKIWVESKFGEGSTFYFTLPKEKLN